VNLNESCNVLFGGVPATNVAFGSATAMSATTPPHPAGAVDVLLVCAADSFNFANGFTYVSSSPIVSASSRRSAPPPAAPWCGSRARTFAAAAGRFSTTSRRAALSSSRQPR